MVPFLDFCKILVGWIIGGTLAISVAATALDHTKTHHLPFIQRLWDWMPQVFVGVSLLALGIGTIIYMMCHMAKKHNW